LCFQYWLQQSMSTSPTLPVTTAAVFTSAILGFLS
jgi:hypothetical protein